MDNRMSYTLILYVLLLGYFLAITSCTVMPAPKRDHISAKLPDHFSGGKEIAEHMSYCWKRSFPSKRLQADVQTLINQNFELEAARARVEQAAAAYGIAAADLKPTLEATADFERSRVKEDGTTITGNTISFEAALYWEPDIWGRIKAKKNAAYLSIKEQQALKDQTTLDLQTLLVESWITHHAARKLEQVLVEQRKRNEQLLDLAELRLAQGQGNALDVLQQRGALITAQRALPAVTSRKRRAANAYAVLMGRFPDGQNLPKDQWPTLKRLSALTTPRKLLADRPDLRATFFAVQAADQEVAAAVASRLPSLSLGMSLAKSGSTLSNIGKDSVLSFTSGLLAPIFDAGRLKANETQRKAQVHESLAVLEQTMLAAVREVEDAISLENALLDEQKLLQVHIEIAKNTVDKAMLRYVNGQDTFLSVLVSLVDLQTLQQNEILLQQDLLINRGRLLKALGVKWSYHRETS